MTPSSAGLRGAAGMADRNVARPDRFGPMRAALAGGPGVLHVYHPLGFPAPGRDLAYLEAAIANGAQVLELGLPFSDPSADGPVLQDAMQAALRAGATTQAALATVRAVRERHPAVAIVAMAYANALHVRGWQSSAHALAAAGADAVLVPDMPLREAVRVRPVFAAAALRLVPLAAATVPDATLASLPGVDGPFAYVASLGVTGGQGPGADALTTVQRLRRLAPDLPIAVGFGVRNPADARRLRAAGAHGVVVGSALVRRIADGATVQEHAADVLALREACR